MTIVVIHHSSSSGQSALKAGLNTAHSRQEELLVLAARSGAQAAGATAAEYEAIKTDVITAIGDNTAWRLELVPPGEDPVGAVVEHIDAIAPSLVVLGTRHRSAVGKLLLGHSQQRFLLEIDQPILLVKPDRARA